MANRRLSESELKQAHKLLDFIRERLKKLSSDDPGLLFAFRRKVAKELTYDERSKPMARRRLKALKLKQQNGICPECKERLPETEAELDRKNAIDGYTEANTELIHHECHRKRQSAKIFA
ncbi:MAG: hypothetical protein WCD12_16875 [Candidatus Binatus sp.]|uniref:hypothetical protein n=1 Tax=Candidatus Binatus sp. TaxID=2811406 RepID=UPI003C723881